MNILSIIEYLSSGRVDIDKELLSLPLGFHNYSISLLAILFIEK